MGAQGQRRSVRGPTRRQGQRRSDRGALHGRQFLFTGLLARRATTASVVNFCPAVRPGVGSAAEAMLARSRHMNDLHSDPRTYYTKENLEALHQRRNEGARPGRLILRDGIDIAIAPI